MTFNELKDSLTTSQPPKGLSAPLLALWYEARDDWLKAHITAQEGSSDEASWVHAYLHRKEGDTSNADYWYAKAGKNTSSLSLEQEWEEIAKALLNG